MAWIRFLAIIIAFATAPFSAVAWMSAASLAGADRVLASMPMNGDCSDLPMERGDPQSSAKCCVAACTATLLALPPTAEAVASLAATPPLGITAVFDGLVGEVATPPPRFV